MKKSVTAVMLLVLLLTSFYWWSRERGLALSKKHHRIAASAGLKQVGLAFRLNRNEPPAFNITEQVPAQTTPAQ